MKTFEPQYQWQVQQNEELGPVEMGLTSGSTYRSDPRRLVFLLSRYKFASKILRGKTSVLEIGCGDGFGSQLLLQELEDYVGIDIDPVYIGDAKSRYKDTERRVFNVHNILTGPFLNLENKFDAAVSLDVLEHIQTSDEAAYMKNICDSLKPNGIMVVGMPTIESQIHASGGGLGHVNCKSGNVLRELLQGYFENTLLFSMNDEVVHTGFEKMAHYIIAVGIGLKLR